MSAPAAPHPISSTLPASVKPWLLAALVLAAECGFAQGAAPATPAAAPAASAAKPAAKPASAAKVAGKTTVATRPTWRELSPAQQKSLAPLSAKWETLSEGQKRKWIALSENFPHMTQFEQDKLHSRMTEWVGLSAQQRTQARLNFGETKKIAPDERKAAWEAYQALSPEEKKKLAAGVAKAPTTAAAVRPVPADKLAHTPKAAASKPRTDMKTPRIAAAPHQVDHNTLLPQPAASAPPAPVSN